MVLQPQMRTAVDAPPDRRWTGASIVRLPAFMAFLVLLAGICGCDEQEPIRHYSVDKPPAPVRAPLPEPEPMHGMGGMQSQPAPPAERTDPPTDRILGAIVSQGERTWFFKVQGPIAATESVVKPFGELVRTVRFENDQPNWDLPPGWEPAQNPEGKGRFATVSIPADGKPLEMTVSALVTPSTDPAAYLLMNVNRWRGQLKQPRFGAEGFFKNSETIKLEDDLTAWVVNLVGWTQESEGPLTRPPMASAGQERPAQGSPKLPFQYKVTDTWAPAELNQFRIAAWKVKDGDQLVTITVTVAGGNLVDNVNRWRGQVKLPPLDAAELRKTIQEIKMGSATGSYVVLAAPEGTENPETILGVVVPTPDRQYFLKMQGNSPLAARERQNFEAFVQSVQFP